MSHLTDEELRGAARPDGHLATCAACHLRWDSWRGLSAATREAAAALAPDAHPPAFDVLLPQLRPVSPPVSQPMSQPAPRPVEHRRSWRTTGLLVRWQLRLMPRSLLPLSVGGLAAAVVIALITPDALLASRYFAAAVVLVALLGSLATVSRRGDPRGELLFAVPTSPVTVFTARLVLVLTADLLLALAGSVAVHAAGIGGGVFDLVTGWLGQSLLASAIAVAGAVRWSSGVGAAAGVAAWCLGSLTTLARGGLAERVGAVASQIWGTTPWTLALVLLLFVLAARRLRLPEGRRELA